MRILIYSPQMAPYGGIEQHLCMLTSALAADGHSVTLVTTSNSLGEPMRAVLRAAGCEFFEMAAATGTASRLQKWLWIGYIVERLRRRAWDVVYTNGQSGLARSFWRAASGKTRVFHHHHTAADVEEVRTWNRAFRKVLLTSPSLVANSKAAANAIKSETGRGDVAVLAYLTPELFTPEEVATRSRANEPLRIGFCGRLVSTKGIEIVCALSERAEFSDVRWHVHGSGADYAASFFEEYPRVIYHGSYATRDAYRAVLLSLDGLVLFTRHSEGQPLSLTEAMAAGLPWIATDRGGTRELALSENNSRIVPPEATLDEIARLTRAWLDDISAGRTDRVAQRGVYDRYFSPIVMAQRWKEYFGLDSPAKEKGPS